MTRPEQHHAIEALFAPRVVRAFVSPSSPTWIAELRSDEASETAPMADSRKAEFATARACARFALASLGVDASIPRRHGGAPLWPVGMAGSISHTKGFCAAIASAEDIAIGLDAEEYGRMKPSIERRILVDTEAEGLDALDDHDRRIRVATIFAAKEAFYKAHYEVDPRYLGFDAVTVTLAGNDIHFGPASGATSDALLREQSGGFWSRTVASSPG